MKGFTLTRPPQCGVGLGYRYSAVQHQEHVRSVYLLANAFRNEEVGLPGDYFPQLIWLCKPCYLKVRDKKRKNDRLAFQWIDKPPGQLLLL